jgi:hypothetical protein
VGARREAIDYLSDAIRELGRHDAAEVLAEARSEARTRVRSMLTDALTQAMLDHTREHLLPGDRSASGGLRHTPGPEAAVPGPDAPTPRPKASTPGAEAPTAGPEAPTAGPEAPTAGPEAPTAGPEAAVPAPEAPTPGAEAAVAARAEGAVDVARDRDSDAEPAWYVYGVVRAEDAPPAAELGGADDPRTLAVTDGGLTAVVSQVPAAEFAEDELRAHLNDMDWVETVALDHERVLDSICRQTTVIPMRLCTVYKTERGVREMLLREADTLLEALDQLDGKTEWGVKLFFERPQESRAPIRERASGESASGASYMNDRRQQRDRARQLDEQVEAVVALIHERLDSLSEESTLNPPQRPEISAHPGEMVLNGAYLVKRESEQEFHEEARALQSRFADNGIELVLTGPWPAYNFLPGRIGAAW